jgi:hypothetical protein
VRSLDFLEELGDEQGEGDGDSRDAGSLDFEVVFASYSSSVEVEDEGEL